MVTMTSSENPPVPVEKKVMFESNKKTIGNGNEKQENDENSTPNKLVYKKV